MNYLEYLEDKEAQRANGTQVTEPLTNLDPDLLLKGKYNHEEKVKNGKKEIDAVINRIDYTAPNGKPACFYAVATDLSNPETNKTYPAFNVGLTKEIEETIADPKNLLIEYDFKTIAGKKRTFVVPV